MYVCLVMDVQGCHNCGPPTHFLSSLGPVFKIFGGKRKAISCLVFNVYFGFVLFVPYSGSGDCVC